MTSPDEKIIGQQILAKIDHLIEVVFAAGLKSPQEAKQAFSEGCQLTHELFKLLEQIIGPQIEYLEIAVKELVAQRIPDQRLLHGFNDFQPLLDEICRQAISSDFTPQGGGNIAEEKAPVSISKVERALALLFPHETILRKHRHNGLYFDYFLPSEKIAIEETVNGREAGDGLKGYLCRREGIRILSVDPLSGCREIIRQIRRQVAL